ncbi:MAG: hydroxylamine reductase [Candidatus Omnitrophica bacterium]|nr:hydroxylamine reductase [Candidatus Omnitrophota bacterium]
MSMFCRQCEQTAKGTGCTVKGVCGKEEQVAVLQDVLLYNLKGIGVIGKLAREVAVEDEAADRFVMEALFSTVTNVNFDRDSLKKLVDTSNSIKEKLKKRFLEAYKSEHGREYSKTLPKAVYFNPASTLEGLLEQGKELGVMSGNVNEDIRSLRELLLYGLKGMAAYADHAFVLGKKEESISAYFYYALAALLDDNLTANELVGIIMEFGEVNLSCLQILDSAHVEHFGNPVPIKVSCAVKKGPAIIISGHDLLDLEQLLNQTQGKGINIYTHGEMLPAHGYPGLSKYKHLAGHFGSAWQNQQKEFDAVPAAVLMTTNCIQSPKDSYKDRIFTTGLVAWPGVEHIQGKDGKKDFSRVIDRALKLGGFLETREDKKILTGFGHSVVLSLADKIIEAVKAKKVRHFFLIGGCDGAKPGRNYYTEFAQKVPQDCIILTLACGKFRFNKLDFGAIGEFPRLLDCGQCNDAYSAIVIASELARAFNCTVNDLPLSLILSWYEQKAVCILITLLSLGIKNIKIGPSLPAFISPNVLKILADKFNIQPISTPEEDLKAILA